MEMRRRYEDITSLDVNIHDTAAFVDKYIDRLKIGFIPINVWNGFVKIWEWPQLGQAYLQRRINIM